MAGLKQLNWASEGVGATAAALVDLSTVAGNKISNPPWVKFQSAGWVNFPSAPTQLDATKQQSLKQLINDIDRLCSSDLEIGNAAYMPAAVLEHLIAEASSDSKIGTLSTHPHICWFMVSLLRPTPDQRIIDPMAGTGTLLISALEYIRENMSAADRRSPASEVALVGVDLDQIQSRIAWTRLFLHGVAQPAYTQGNSLSAAPSDGEANDWLKQHYDLVLVDVPFGGRLHPQEAWKPKEYASVDPLPGGDRVELLAVWRALSLLKPGGQAALVVPQGLLTHTGDAHIRLRRELLQNHCVEAIFLLPGKLFAPFTGIKAAILIVRKPLQIRSTPPRPSDTPMTRAVWFYDVVDDGVSTDPRVTTPVTSKDDLVDALKHFMHRTIDSKLWADNQHHYYQPQAEARSRSDYFSNTYTTEPSTNDIKQWEVSVRSWREATTPSSNEEPPLSSHDSSGELQPAYVERMTPSLYTSDKLNAALLTRDCIEARNWSLDPQRYKPLVQRAPENDTPVLALIEELETLEEDILQKLKDLRALVGPLL